MKVMPGHLICHAQRRHNICEHFGASSGMQGIPITFPCWPFEQLQFCALPLYPDCTEYTHTGAGARQQMSERPYKPSW